MLNSIIEELQSISDTGKTPIQLAFVNNFMTNEFGFYLKYHDLENISSIYFGVTEELCSPGNPVKILTRDNLVEIRNFIDEYLGETD